MESGDKLCDPFVSYGRRKGDAFGSWMCKQASNQRASDEDFPRKSGLSVIERKLDGNGLGLRQRAEAIDALDGAQRQDVKGCGTAFGYDARIGRSAVRIDRKHHDRPH